MKIEKSNAGMYNLSEKDMVEGCVYEDSGGEVFIATDEGNYVNLGSGTQWACEDVAKEFREVSAKVVIE